MERLGRFEYGRQAGQPGYRTLEYGKDGTRLVEHSQSSLSAVIDLQN